MKEEVYAPDPLNEQASVLVDAQTDIKTAIKQEVLSGHGKEAVKARVKKIIERAIARIRSPTLKKDGRISLMRFADSAYAQFAKELRTIPSEVIPYIIVLMRAITSKEPKGKYYVPQTAAERTAANEVAKYENLTYKVRQFGVPLQEFTKTYINRVDSALGKLAESKGYDPNDVTGRNSLRNLAEMQVRYERHQEEIESFKTKGTKLVVCSAHADCSGRCAKWQGRVYSLDGTRGRTEDGRDYVPLEEATDVYYTTKAGRTYKNGLLGFNCRHKLFEFKPGMATPTLSSEKRKREYSITQKQRELERRVIYYREKALIDKDTNITEYRKWRKLAQEANAEYKRFSEEHKRPYYPDRVKII